MSNPEIKADFGGGRQRSVPISDFPSNSHKTRPEKKKRRPEDFKVDSVVTGKVVAKKKGVFSRLIETFTGDDIHSVGSYVLFEVMVPSAKTMLQDMISEGSSRLLFGDSSRGRRPSARGFTTYNRFYSEAPPQPRDISKRGRANHDFSELVFESRQEAQGVIDILSDVIDEYGFASVSDLYDAAGITAEHTDNKWGWSNIRDAQVYPTRGGYLLTLTRPTPLD